MKRVILLFLIFVTMAVTSASVAPEIQDYMELQQRFDILVKKRNALLERRNALQQIRKNYIRDSEQ